MTDIVLEIIRSCILFGIVCYLWKAGRERAELFRGGWKLILGGFILLLFASLLDITDNFETLNRYVVIGDTATQALLEKIVGYLGGFLLVSIGLARWIPTVSTVKGTQALSVKLKAIKEALQREVAWRMMSEQAIDVAKKKLEGIMESMIDGVTVVDMNGRIIAINRATTEQHGYTKEEVIGKTPGEIFIEKKDNPKFLGALRRLASGETIRGEGYLAKRKDGTNFRASVNLSLIKDAKGKPVAITAVHRDVTEREKAGETLQESERKYRELVKTSVDGVVSIDEQMKIVLWNLGAERIFGYSEKEILGQSLMKIVPERYRKKKEEGFVGFRRTGTGPVIGKTLELEGLRKDGT